MKNSLLKNILDSERSNEFTGFTMIIFFLHLSSKIALIFTYYNKYL